MDSEQFTYRPLNNDEIRLLILPAKDTAEDLDIIVCTTTQRQLSTLGLRYEALSYVWGTVAKTEWVTCLATSSITSDGDITSLREEFDFQSSGVLAVTKSLHDALIHLRRDNLPRIIWADALCINQNNLSERSAQVQRMAEIYRSSWRVVVWLGVDPAITEALTIVQCFNSEAEATGEVPQDDPAEYDYLVQPLLADNGRGLCLFYQFFEQSWFQRAWVFQEAVVQRNTIVVSGDSAMTFDALWGVALILNYSPSILDLHTDAENASDLHDRLPRRRAAVRRINDMTARRLTYLMYTRSSTRGEHSSFNSFDPVDLLQCVRSCEATDSRDKVYCIASLLDDWINVDYTLSVRETYIMATRALLQSKSNDKLAFLSYVQSTDEVHNLPSWVPDWSVASACRVMNYWENRSRNLFLSNEAVGELGSENNSVTCILPTGSDSLLSTVGAIFAMVTSTVEYECQNTAEEVQDMLRTLPTWYPGTSLSYNEVLRRLCVPQWSDSGNHISPLDPPVATTTWSNGIMLGFAADGRQVTAREDLGGCASGRRILRTNSWDRIELGLGPLGSRRGDLVCLLAGIGIPCVIRLLGNGRYEFIGGK